MRYKNGDRKYFYFRTLKKVIIYTYRECGVWLSEDGSKGNSSIPEICSDTPELAIIKHYKEQLKQTTERIIANRKNLEIAIIVEENLNKEFGYLKDEFPEEFI